MVDRGPVMSADDPFGLVGTVLDQRYRIDSTVGEGGFGVVYAAHHIAFDESVAVKILKLPASVTERERDNVIQTFRNEGRYLRGLAQEHPAFVRALDAGTFVTRAGTVTPYLVLEWLDGEALEEELAARRDRGERGRSLSDAMALLSPIADALSVAHKNRVAHCDIKPANIFITKDGDRRSARLLDFGLARIMKASGSGPMQTTSGERVGGLTAQYAAPEQWYERYGATGPWTDVYAFALVLCELLTDKPALRGDETPQLLAATIDATDRPTPRARGAPVSAAVELVFRRALALNAKDRFRTLNEFWSALESALSPTRDEAAETLRGPFPIPEAPDDSQPHASEPRAPEEERRKSRPWAARASIAGLVLAGVVAATVLQLRARASSARAALDAEAHKSPPAIVWKDHCPDTMAYFPESTFWMGSAEDDPDMYSDETPLHEVHLNPFCLDLTEVTVAAYDECPVSDSGCSRADAGRAGCNEGKEDRLKHPINCVTSTQADAYCKWREGALPTEAQWEFAAGGKEKRKYPWGSALPDMERLAWRATGTSEVGAHPSGATPEGLLDMAGNVREWTADGWLEHYPAKKVNNPVVLRASSRVARGGGWLSTDARHVRSAVRNFSSNAFSDVGFRCARVPR